MKGRSGLNRWSSESRDFANIVVITCVSGDGYGVEQEKKLRPWDPESTRRLTVRMDGIQLSADHWIEQIIHIACPSMWIADENELHSNRLQRVRGQDRKCMIAMNVVTSIDLGGDIRTTSGRTNDQSREKAMNGSSKRNRLDRLLRFTRGEEFRPD